jgi:hypothetical protein
MTWEFEYDKRYWGVGLTIDFTKWNRGLMLHFGPWQCGIGW